MITASSNTANLSIIVGIGITRLTLADDDGHRHGTGVLLRFIRLIEVAHAALEVIVLDIETGDCDIVDKGNCYVVI